MIAGSLEFCEPFIPVFFYFFCQSMSNNKNNTNINLQVERSIAALNERIDKLSHQVDAYNSSNSKLAEMIIDLRQSVDTLSTKIDTFVAGNGRSRKGRGNSGRRVRRRIIVEELD
jgi:septal ring factor EnvC (AmiA/AmiB activator)